MELYASRQVVLTEIVKKSEMRTMESEKVYSKEDVRQAEPAKTNRHALEWGLPLAIIAVGGVAVWMWLG